MLCYPYKCCRFVSQQCMILDCILSVVALFRLNPNQSTPRGQQTSFKPKCNLPVEYCITQERLCSKRWIWDTERPLIVLSLTLASSLCGARPNVFCLFVGFLMEKTDFEKCLSAPERETPQHLRGATRGNESLHKETPLPPTKVVSSPTTQEGSSV